MGMIPLANRPSKQQKMIKWTTIGILTVFLLGTFLSSLTYFF